MSAITELRTSLRIMQTQAAAVAAAADKGAHGNTHAEALAFVAEMLTQFQIDVEAAVDAAEALETLIERFLLAVDTEADATEALRMLRRGTTQ